MNLSFKKPTIVSISVAAAAHTESMDDQRKCHAVRMSEGSWWGSEWCTAPSRKTFDTVIC